DIASSAARASQCVTAITPLKDEACAIASRLTRPARIAALAADNPQAFDGVRAGECRSNRLQSENVQKRDRICGSEADLAILFSEAGVAERPATGPLGYLSGGAASSHVSRSVAGARRGRVHQRWNNAQVLALPKKGELSRLKLALLGAALRCRDQVVIHSVRYRLPFLIQHIPVECLTAHKAAIKQLLPRSVEDLHSELL